jgi:hypothetical protein
MQTYVVRIVKSELKAVPQGEISLKHIGKALDMGLAVEMIPGLGLTPNGIQVPLDQPKVLQSAGVLPMAKTK